MNAEPAAAFTGLDFADLNDTAIIHALDIAKPLNTEKPRPLYRDLPEPASFPVKALGPVLADAAMAIEGMIKCPIECAVNSVLAVASLAAQGRANVILPIGQGKPSPLSLYLLTVLESGERKSSADSMALQPVRAYERELADMEAGDRQTYNIKAAAYATTEKQLHNQHKKDRAALEAALHQLGPAPLPPLLSVLAPSGDQTMEGLFRIYQFGRPSLAMLCDDAASFLGGHSLKAEQKQGTTANLCRAWDGSKLERVRGGDGVTVLYDRRLACHLMVQPGVASAFLSDPQFADQGLLARFLVSAPKGTAGTRFRDDTAYQAEAALAARRLEAYNAAIGHLIRQPIRWKNETDHMLGVDMDELHLTAEARALYVSFANATELEMAPTASLATVKPFTSKLPEQAVRIAGVLTLVADPNATEISGRTLADAIALARYYLSEAERFTASGMVDPELKAAQTLLDWLHTRKGNRIGLVEVYQRGPNFLRSADKARAAMVVLAGHNWAKVLPGGADIDGKRCGEAWEIVRC